MEEQRNDENRPVNPRRKRKTKVQIFKETYLPVIIAGVALILIIVFIIGSITRAVQKNRAEKEAEKLAASSQTEEKTALDYEADRLLAQAEDLAESYDYQAAIDVLNSFSGDLSVYTNLNDKIIEYERAIKNLVAWDDPNQVVNLSFQLLIADPVRGFSHETYSDSINRNFITTVEFSKILQQLYNNGYILVDFDDFIAEETDANGTTIYKAKTLYLPKGKKPIMLTQTNVNYNYYLIDSDEDKIPDANGGGFASKLLWDGQNFTCEMVDSSGNTVTGAYDLVPILESFVKEHPTFSYKGAKATLALTGYNGLFGYRTHPSAANLFGEEAYRQAIQDATVVANALREHGYTLACYTYENIPYGDYGINQIKSDLNNWTNEVVPVLGNLDILVYAQLTDITEDAVYSGEKYNTLKDQGFRYYLGFCENGTPWTTVTNDYVRQGRILVTGSAMAHHADWFTDLFDPTSVLDTTRGTVPG